ncbi:MAG: hypothetical protein ABSE85_17140 [Candidatus Korobacteraceae bacterium]|jgi:hypothetical protein
MVEPRNRAGGFRQLLSACGHGLQADAARATRRQKTDARDAELLFQLTILDPAGFAGSRQLTPAPHKTSAFRRLRRNVKLS